MNKLLTALTLFGLILISGQTSATPLSAFDGDYAVNTWDLEGPRAQLRANRKKNRATFRYNANRKGYDAFDWSFTHVAETTETIFFDWNWRGNHSKISSSGTLSFINNGIKTLLGESDGFGNFKASGTFSTVISAGDVFGFQVTGQHFDPAQRLRGRVQVYNLYSEPVQSVPAPSTTLFILGLLALVCARIRKAKHQ